jgi:RNA polymerase-binding transcription factor DksA
VAHTTSIYMKAAGRAHFRTLLEAERDRLHELLTEANAVPATIGASPPGDEGEPGVAGAAVVDDAAIIARFSASLADVHRALQLLEADPEEYGICTECGSMIADGRLELVPTTRRCARHADLVG